MPNLSRRSFFTGLSALIAAPAIVKASSLMPVRGIIMPVDVKISIQIEWTCEEIHAALAEHINRMIQGETERLLYGIPLLKDFKFGLLNGGGVDLVTVTNPLQFTKMIGNS